MIAGVAALAMLAQYRSGSDLLPHAFCISASPALLWVHLVSDALIAFAYLVIPWAMLHFTHRRPDIPLGWISWVFGAFIVACGLTHAFDVWTLFHPVYWAAGVTKAFAAVASLATAWLLYRLMPYALALPSAGQLRLANAALTTEVRARETAEAQLRDAKAQVEKLLLEAQRRADESTAVLARFFEEAPMGMAIVDATMEVQQANPALLRMLRLEPARAARPVFRPPREVASALVKLEAGSPRQSIENVVGEGEETRLLRSAVFAISIGQGLQYGWIAQDATTEVNATRDRLQALESLAEANRKVAEESAQFQALADNIAQLAWMTDETGWISWYNRRWFEYTGTTLAQMEGWGWRQVHHPDHLDRVEAKFRAHIDSGEEWEDTFPLRGRDGSFRWFLSRAFPLRSATGDVVRWFGTNTDIDEQVLAQQALQEADRRKNDFIATLAHELRNPLAPVRNAAEILARTASSDERSNRATAILLRQTTHMARLIDDLLDVARIGRGQLQVLMERCDLGEIVRSVCHDYETSLRATANSLVVEVEDPLPVTGDPVRLAQAIGNYLQNASRFAPGSAVTVHAFRDAVRSECVIHVRDRGPGMAPEIADTLFQPFSQGKQDLARTKGGLGLGLVLTRGIVELHGGSVAAWNDPPAGAVFELRLPLRV